MAKMKARENKPKFQKRLAEIFQKMIRAEYGAKPSGFEWVIKDGKLALVYREVGFVACVTCGKVAPWSSAGKDQMDGGHFIGGRRNSILFEEANIAPQCVKCNKHLHGRLREYRMWMDYTRGPEEIERLEKLNRVSVSFTTDELEEMRDRFSRRLKEAEAKIKEYQ